MLLLELRKRSHNDGCTIPADWLLAPALWRRHPLSGNCFASVCNFMHVGQQKTGQTAT
jgi:hypothetical protein